MNNTNKNNTNMWAEKLLMPFLFDDTLEVQNVCEAFFAETLSTKEVLDTLEKMKRKSTLKKEYPIESIKTRPDGRYYIYINRKQFIASTYDKLIDKLFVYEKEMCMEKETLKSIFPTWQIYRRDVECVASNTLKDHTGYWNNYMKDSALVKIPITQITARDIKNFYKSVVTNNSISKGTFDFIKTILNKLFDFAISELEIIQFNPIPSISTRPYKNSFKSGKDTYDDVYKKDERDKLLDYLKDIDDNIYSLATQLAFRLIIRIGELKALRWSDIDENEDYIYIHNQTIENQVMNDDLTFERRTVKTVDYIKGQTEKGKRKQALTPEAKEILKKMRTLNPDGEFIFTKKDGSQLVTCTFNDNLRRFCEKAGVTYRSSHKIRFTSASMLYNGKNLALLSRLLGHSTTTMTLHYFRNIRGDEEIKELMSQLDREAYEIA